MREVKFRYWLKSKDGEDQGFRCLTLPEIEESPYPLKADWEILARDQWTGLTDKNGQDIYEGDILRIILGRRQRLYLIQWCGVGFEAVEKEGSNPLTYESYEFAEVAGNIHENRESVQ